MKNWVVGNWKMNGSLEMVSEFVPAMLDGLLDTPGWEQQVRVGICPPHPYLALAARKVAGYPVAVGAQNVNPVPKGAYTGEVAASMLSDVGATLCIVGHSERRQYYKETDVLISEKLGALLSVNIMPILCVGETREQREAGEERAVVERQLTGGLNGFSAERAECLVVAYEPVWAIGTGLTASPHQANGMHAFIRGVLRNVLGAAAEQVPLLYGGSVTPDNAGDLMAQPEINGALVGGASLKAETFVPIIKQSLK